MRRHGGREERAPRATRLLIVALALPAVALNGDCLAPTEVTLDITTDLDCGKHLTVGITSAPQNTLWSSQADGTETDACDHGEVGSLVLVPGESRTFSVRVIGAVGFSANECATGKPDPGSGHGDPRKPSPAHPDWGCIQATRGLGFVSHKPLRLPIRLYAKCLGKFCDAGQTCGEDGGCHSDLVGDCGPEGLCGEPSQGSGGATGSSATSSSGGGATNSSATGSGAAGGAGAGGCGPIDTDPKNCGACGHDCLGGDCVAMQCQPVVLGTAQADLQLFGGVAVDAKNVYWTVKNKNGNPMLDGVYKRPKDLSTGPVQLGNLLAAYDVAVSNKEAFVARTIPGNCALERCPLPSWSCLPTISTCPVAVGGDPAADALAYSNSGGVIFRYQGVSLPKLSEVGVTDVAVLDAEVAYSHVNSVSYFNAKTMAAPIGFTGAAAARGVALIPGATVATVGNGVFVSTDRMAAQPIVSTAEEGAHQIAAIPWKGGGLAAWTIDTMPNAVPAIRFVVFDPKAPAAAPASTLAKAKVPVDVALDASAVYWADNGDGNIYALALP